MGKARRREFLDYKFVDMDSDRGKNFVFLDYQLHIFHQCICTKLRYAQYACALESQVLYKVLLSVVEDIYEKVVLLMTVYCAPQFV